ncbi:O-antigen ligase family protein [Sphingomonas phyllosphaerae]|uniref:O-antigen ligase family protein n=1 Tax=Sphingomonas phyllosphaerae TaxID=257003 RepID=UPI002413AF69|nr:O-antigen ligase family protein [Sphingomonas phyllosphaerae]
MAALFALLPLAAGLVFRTYTWGVSPRWFEAVRQLDLFYAAIEVAVIMFARHRGLSYGLALQRLPRDTRYVVIGFLATFWLGSAFVAGPVAYSMTRAMLWPIHILFGAALYHLRGASDAAAVRRFVLLLTLGYVAYFPMLALHFLTAPEPSTVPGGAIIWTSALPGYLSVRHFGIETGATLALLIGALWRDPAALHRRWLGFAAILLIGGAACWSGTRAAMFGVAGAIIITIVGRRIPPRTATVVIVIAALTLGGAVAQLIVPPNVSFGFRVAPPAYAAGGYTSGRVDLWIASLRLFLERPLTGWGEGSALWLITWNDVSFAHPHNTPLQMLESWGLPATLAALYLMARSWYALQHRGRGRSELLPILMAVDALLIMSLVDGVFFHARLVMMVAVMVVMGLRHAAPPAPFGSEDSGIA